MKNTLTTDMPTFKIDIPLFVSLPRKKVKDKRIALNLNIFRNLSHFVMNDAKIQLANQLQRVILSDKTDVKTPTSPPPYIFIYTLYTPTNRRCDVGNVLPAVQKFVDDALTHLGIIQDDNYSIVHTNIHRFGGIDKDKPRATLEILPMSEYSLAIIPVSAE